MNTKLLLKKSGHAISIIVLFSLVISNVATVRWIIQHRSFQNTQKETAVQTPPPRAEGKEISQTDVNMLKELKYLFPTDRSSKFFLKEYLSEEMNRKFFREHTKKVDGALRISPLAASGITFFDLPKTTLDFFGQDERVNFYAAAAPDAEDSWSLALQSKDSLALTIRVSTINQMKDVGHSCPEFKDENIEKIASYFTDHLGKEPPSDLCHYIVSKAVAEAEARNIPSKPPYTIRAYYIDWPAYERDQTTSTAPLLFSNYSNFILIKRDTLEGSGLFSLFEITTEQHWPREDPLTPKEKAAINDTISQIAGSIVVNDSCGYDTCY